jgi:mRNA interferase MazF
VIRQGEIYLADFGERYSSQFGKRRPALVVQNDFFNRAINDGYYRQVLVAPLSTKPIEDDYRIPIKKRQHLERDSYIVTNWLCTLDLEQIDTDAGPIASLTGEEFERVRQRICEVVQIW